MSGRALCNCGGGGPHPMSSPASCRRTQIGSYAAWKVARASCPGTALRRRQLELDARAPRRLDEPLHHDLHAPLAPVATPRLAAARGAAPHCLRAGASLAARLPAIRGRHQEPPREYWRLRCLTGIDKLSPRRGPTPLNPARIAPYLDDDAHCGSRLSRRRHRTTPFSERRWLTCQYPHEGAALLPQDASCRPATLRAPSP